MPQTLPTAVNQDVEYEDFYETTLAQPLGTSDTDIYPEVMPQSESGFLVIDPAGSTPEVVFYNFKGSTFVRCPSAVDGEGRGVFSTTPNAYTAGVKIGMYSTAAFFEGIVTGKLMRDGFLQSRHFSADIDPNVWIGAGDNFTFGANLGQNVSTYLIAGDVTAKYGKGTKLQLPRVTATNTKCVDLEASSSQYANKTSPSGIVFTDDFTCESYVKLESYTANGGIVGRASSGEWALRINVNGQVEMYGINASSNGKIVTSNQSIPLGVWTHIAATLDMSGGLGTIYINGTLVPSVVTNLGSGATALVQSGDLYLGKNPPTANYFDGKVSEVRVWSAIRTANQIKDNYNKRLVGNETNLVGYWRLDGTFDDTSPNANHLTGQAGAVATTVDNPFSVTEHGVVLDAAFSAGNTTLTVFGGTQRSLPAETLTNVAYSYLRTPPGFPVASTAWAIESIYLVSSGQSLPTANTWYNFGGEQLAVPIGEWNLGWQAYLYITKTGGGALPVKTTLSTASNSQSDPLMTTEIYANNITELSNGQSVRRPITVISPVTYYLNALTGASSVNSINHIGTVKPTIIRAQCPYI